VHCFTLAIPIVSTTSHLYIWNFVVLYKFLYCIVSFALEQRLVLSSSLEQRSVLFSSAGQVDQQEIKVASVFSKFFDIVGWASERAAGL